MIAAVLNSPFNFATAPAPPPGGDPYYADTVLILNGDGANNSTTAIDSSPAARTMTAFGNAKLSTTAPAFGTASMLFDGADDSFRAAASADFSFGTSPFTIECWVKFASVSGLQFLCSGGGAGNDIRITNGTTLLIRGQSATVISATITAPTAGIWTHMALVRDGSNWTFYVDGNSVASGTSTSAFGVSNNTFFIGSNSEGGFSLNGGMEFRMTKGVARYTSNFTPPTAAFSDS